MFAATTIFILDPKDEESEEVEEIEAESLGSPGVYTHYWEEMVTEKYFSYKYNTRAKCTIMIDSRSCENIISQTPVDRLKLKVYKHNRP